MGMLVIHDPRCAEYGTSDRPEKAARVVRTAAHLRAAFPAWAWQGESVPVADETLLLAHRRAHLLRLEEPRDFDADTPFVPGIAQHARRAVAAALAAGAHALAGRGPVFSLLRPPGHHATAGRAMGFCYLNQIAVAALAAQRDHGARVAVWDFDAHHGNGTEEILHGREGLLFCSVHQSPGYPGTGLQDAGNVRNWPVAPQAPRAVHLAALRESFDAVCAFRPDLILVSAGFDAYRGDPITEMTLESGDFATLGGWLRGGGIPAAALLEGGYSDELPQLVASFLSSWAG